MDESKLPIAVKRMEDSPKMGKMMGEGGDPGEDVHALMRAYEIRKNRKRFSAVRKHVTDASRAVFSDEPKSGRKKRGRRSRSR